MNKEGHVYGNINNKQNYKMTKYIFIAKMEIKKLQNV